MSNPWSNLNPRERLLAGIVAFLVTAVIVAVLANKMLANLGTLDAAIAQRQDTLINYSKQLARSQSVDEAYAQVAAMHSSQWTEAEIHDRLRQEIYRLALKEPPPVGAPINPTRDNTLVRIPTLRQGTLREGGEGYREYELTLGIPRTTIDDLMTFLERLQASEQSLRIDAFQISRSPMSDAVSCMLEVTRTVVDGAPETPRSGPASDQRNGTIRVGLGERVEAWKTAHCELARVADEAALGPDCVRARAEKSDASLSLPVELDTGADYVLFVDLKATAPASLGVRPQGNNQSDRSNIDVPGDGKRRQYHLRFSVPGPPGRQTVFEAPVIAFGEENGEVLVDGIVLRKTVG